MSVVVAIAMALGLIAAGLALFTMLHTRRLETRYPATGDLVDIGAGVLHVVDRSSRGEERAVVLLVHGASGNFADMSEALAQRLNALGFRVLSVDRPGHGWSERMFGRAASAPERQAEMIRAAAGRKGVREAIVVVHSLAGVLGLAMSLQAPEFVRGLVLLAPASHPWPGGISWYYTLAAHRWLGPPFRWLLALPLGLALMERGVRSVFTPNPTPQAFVERTRVPLVLRPRHFLANAEDVVDLFAAAQRLSPRYPEIRAHTEIVTGDSDGVVYADIHSAGCARDIPGARLTILPDVGHSPHHSEPERVIEAILSVEARATAKAETLFA